MPSGTSEKVKLGRISRHTNTDYHVAWIAWLRSEHGRRVADVHILPDGDIVAETTKTVLINRLRDAFDAGWDARGQVDLAIINAGCKQG